MAATKKPVHVTRARITRMPAMEVRPGHVIAEGLVLEVVPQGDLLYLDTPLGTSFVDRDGEVQVIANIGQEAAKAAKDAIRRGDDR